MKKKLINKIKDQKGLTLIELLAVIVILGIIAAIAIPSIMGLIDNSKKDAHVANAQQLINSTKIAVTSDKTLLPSEGKVTIVPLSYLEKEGYVETLKDPDDTSTSYVRAVEVADNPKITTNTTEAAAPKDDSYVLIKNTSGQLSYSVRLVNGERGVKAEGGGPVLESDLSRTNVRP